MDQIDPKWGKSEFFQIRFSTFWLTEPKCTESYLKKTQICFVPFGSNLTHLGPKSGHPGLEYSGVSMCYWLNVNKTKYHWLCIIDQIHALCKDLRMRSNIKLIIHLCQIYLFEMSYIERMSVVWFIYWKEVILIAIF